jgi:predicted outer membrane repeat protein
VFSGTAVQFSDNSATTLGGAINVSGQVAVELARARLVGNRAGQVGWPVHLGKQCRSACLSSATYCWCKTRAPEGSGFAGSAARFVNSTISANQGGAAVNIVADASGVVWKNTIVAQNPGGNCQGRLGNNAGNNLQFPNTGCGASIPVSDPRLDSRFLPVSPSLAVGNGDPVTCRNAPIYGRDVYGQRRNDQCAIGAAEADLQNIIYPGGPPAPPTGVGCGYGHGGHTPECCACCCACCPAGTTQKP